MKAQLPSLAPLVLALALALAACSGSRSDAADSLDTAAALLADGRHAEALGMLEAIDTGGLPAPQLGHMAVMYMQLSEADDMDDRTALAFQFYRNSLKADSAAARAYYSTVGPEEARYVQLLEQLQMLIDNPDRGNIPADEEADDTLTPSAPQP